MIDPLFVCFVLGVLFMGFVIVISFLHGHRP